VCVCVEPSGVLQLSVFPLSPTAAVLSWQRPFLVTFRKFVLQMFFFNPVTLSSEWTTYYEISGSASVIASVVTHTHAYICVNIIIIKTASSDERPSLICTSRGRRRDT